MASRKTNTLFNTVEKPKNFIEFTSSDSTSKRIQKSRRNDHYAVDTYSNISWLLLLVQLAESHVQLLGPVDVAR